ncbi:MAG: hypothetical protein KA339_04830 [Candidatus Kapabacteria bacterium]|nr:hypothetical protein [Ignavibacteria bacterium]MBP6509858.1 hypothetical protein [Candidatus Kapabacteria bacterium]MBK6418435.1 hypothetical protein [Ignavibacteria bacterium]MBK7032039.1 hypothetical protein [Ignavibacteria bacterium]MBK7411500.1 hypothetical protein [Ignavibacteria bacterium]
MSIFRVAAISILILAIGCSKRDVVGQRSEGELFGEKGVSVKKHDVRHVIFSTKLCELNKTDSVSVTVVVKESTRDLYVLSELDTIAGHGRSVYAVTTLPRNAGIMLQVKVGSGSDNEQFERSIVRLHNNRLVWSLVMTDSTWLNEYYTGEYGPDAPVWTWEGVDTVDGDLHSEFHFSSDASKLTVRQNYPVFALRNGVVKRWSYSKSTRLFYDYEYGVYSQQTDSSVPIGKINYCVDSPRCGREFKPRFINFIQERVLFDGCHWLTRTRSKCFIPLHTAAYRQP